MQPSVQDCIAAAALAFGIGTRDIRYRGRSQPIVDGRQAAYLLARECGYSFPTIGRVMFRDHSTVLFGVRQARRRAETDLGFAATLSEAWENVRMLAARRRGFSLRGGRDWLLVASGREVSHAAA